MPTTSDGKKFDYTKLGMMKAKMHQQRLDRNNKSMGGRDYGNIALVTLPAMMAGGFGYGVHKMDQRERLGVEQYKAKVAKELGMKKYSSGKWKFSGGGGGGTYNVAQPVADKNIMNKYGKKLK